MSFNLTYFVQFVRECAVHVYFQVGPTMLRVLFNHHHRRSQKLAVTFALVLLELGHTIQILLPLFYADAVTNVVGRCWPDFVAAGQGHKSPP